MTENERMIPEKEFPRNEIFLKNEDFFGPRFLLGYLYRMAKIRLNSLINMAKKKQKMYKKLKALLLSLTAYFVNSCSSAVNKTLSPPSDTQWINVEIKNPSPYTKPFPLQVRYISHDCLKKRFSGFDGSVIYQRNTWWRKCTCSI